MDSIRQITRHKAQLKIPAKLISDIDALLASKSNWKDSRKNKTLPIFTLKAPCDRILQVNCRLDETLEYPYLETILLDESGTKLMTSIYQSFGRTLEIETESRPSPDGQPVQTAYTVTISPGHGHNTYLRNTDKTQWAVVLKPTKSLIQKTSNQAEQPIMTPISIEKSKSHYTSTQYAKPARKTVKTPVSVAVVLPTEAMSDISTWLSGGKSDAGTIVAIQKNNGDKLKLVKTTFGTDSQRVIGLEIKQHNGYNAKTQFNCVCPYYSIQGRGDMFRLHVESSSRIKKPTVRTPASWTIIETKGSETP